MALGKLVAALFVASVASLSGRALAEDPTPLPASVSYDSPTAKRLGCYAGVFAEGVVSHPELTNVPVPGAVSEYAVFGGRGGGLIGCDILFATSAFVGLEATGAYGSLQGRYRRIPLESDMPWEATFRIRVGTMLDTDVAAYVAAGPAAAQLRMEDSLGNHDTGVIVGGQLGAGLEYHFAPNWRVRGEYAFTYYGAESVGLAGLPELARNNPTSHSLRAAVIRNF